MSDQNGLKGGVLLGGRQYTVTMTRELDATLKVLAKINKTSPGTVLDYIVAKGIDSAWEEFMVSKLFWVLATWTQWGRWSSVDDVTPAIGTRCSMPGCEHTAWRDGRCIPHQDVDGSSRVTERTEGT